jgi:hypothetical protein
VHRKREAFVLRKVISAVAASLLATGCVDYQRAYEDCVRVGRCNEVAGRVRTLTAFALPDPRAADFEFIPEGSTCGLSCRTYLEGTQVVVQARPRPGFALVEWAEGCAATPAGGCEVTVGGDAVVRAGFSRVGVGFVTSGAVPPGALGSLRAGDRFCQAHAVDAGLTGDFRAWLSTSTEPARSRFPSDGGWVTTRGEPIAGDLHQLLSSGPMHPVQYDERGRLRASRVSTGTDSLGEVATLIFGGSNNCTSFTRLDDGVALGDSRSGGEIWTQLSGTESESGACDLPRALFCFTAEEGLGAPPRTLAIPAGARRAFLTHGRLLGNFGGFAPAAALCAGEARDAGLSGTFDPLIWVQTALSVKDDGRPWYRMDGVRVYSSDAGVPGLNWTAPLTTDARGQTVLNDSRYEPLYALRGGLGGDCEGWTVADDREQVAVPPGLGATPADLRVTRCRSPHVLFCIER